MRETERKCDKSDKVLAEKSDGRGYRSFLYHCYNFSEMKLLEIKLLKHLKYYFNYLCFYILSF